ncbi:vesicle transport protein use1 [Limosa lapponica baueri]|uniref:Vesicle transport protein USE1 n=1 Tax=Limosa lapponica baueri TaxID=1758121 RepID=A0A2I0TB07_LIMLA|nr:vesicle transport protein use1 [Limosa lapponica baueri]
MAATRLELNLMRLLSRCEALAAERRDPEEWRLEKYVAALEDMLRELKKQGLAPDEKQSAVELDAVLQHHQDMQEKLAEEMLSLARSLKNNTLAAQNVIKQDNQDELPEPRLNPVKLLTPFVLPGVTAEHSASSAALLLPLTPWKNVTFCPGKPKGLIASVAGNLPARNGCFVDGQLQPLVFLEFI